MSWSRFDDLYDDHPKVMAATHASPLAAALHSQAITAASRRESDGLVDPFWLIARAPDKRKRQEALAVLERLRLYDPVEPGETLTATDAQGYTVTLGPFDERRYVVHDYLDFNPSSAQLQDRRRRDAERKASGRRKDSTGIPGGVRADMSRTPGGPRGRAGAGPQPSPIPSQSEETSAATPPRSRAQDTSQSMAETVACPRCGVPAGEKCDGVRGKRESCHLERHHAVGELQHVSPRKPRGPAAIPPDPAATQRDRERREREATFCENFPDVPAFAVMRAVREINATGDVATIEAVRARLEVAA